jgi:hypothetical protein
MPQSDAAMREIAKVVRRHVDQETIEKIVDELFENSQRQELPRYDREACAGVENHVLTGLPAQHEDQYHPERDQHASGHPRRGALRLRASHYDAQQ